ncbi:hypothetical protein KIW84_065990 [Lathyrus oleraceus]|nr:hypothetical protein KIW84_065990 [Pisum sativum]
MGISPLPLFLSSTSSLSFSLSPSTTKTLRNTSFKIKTLKTEREPSSSDPNPGFDPKPGVAVYKPKSYQVLATDASYSLAYALQDGKLHLEIDLPRRMEASNEVEALQQENEELRAVNKELQKSLNLLVQASLENQFGHGGSSVQTQSILSDILHSLRGLSLGDGKENCAGGWNNNNIKNNNNSSKELQEDSDESSTSVIDNNDVDVDAERLSLPKSISVRSNGYAMQEDSDESSTSVIDNNDVDVDAERLSLPKSISVRSNGYVMVAQPPTAVTNNNAGRSTKSATRSQASSTHPDYVQEVYVRGGGQKEEEPLEMTAVDQWRFKTKLCANWQRTGTCPYTDNCQFAHGIGELRPLIRHPRYKTEACRMILTGIVCPYGHRCYFRHELTDQEKAISQSKAKIRKAGKINSLMELFDSKDTIVHT